LELLGAQKSGLKGLARLAGLLILASVSTVDCTHSVSRPKTDSGVDHQPTEGGTDGPTACTGTGTHGKDNGLACACADDCKSNFCVDGVCCDKPCDGKCVSCALSTSLGTCANIVHAPPRVPTDCATDDPSTCNLDGLCDGSGNCERYPAGTICQAGTCDGHDGVMGRYQCDGQGSCKLGASTVCAPFSCDPTTGACFNACSVNTDCVSGRTCNGGSCGEKMNGATCAADAECTSQHCNDGVCCNVDCARVCRTCNLVGKVGTCSPTPEGQAHPMCPTEASSTCGSAGVCDGLGSCSKYPANTVCGPPTCSGNALLSAQACDGLGSCGQREVHDCAPYRCTVDVCTSSCKTNADCADGIACVNGSCGPKQDGQKCGGDAECLNQHCVDSVCCESACQGSCRSCALPNLAGKCALVAVGAADPRAICVDMSAASCGTDGKCDSTGGCRKYATGTVCATETCAGDVYTGQSTCNASGQCIKPSAQACNPYHCNASTCYNACSTDLQCVAPNICGQNGSISQCGPKPRGADCSGDNECGSGHCAQGKCCDNACTNACSACNLSGTAGTCTNVQSGADPQNKCTPAAQATCGNTGMCAAGQCAKFSASTVCLAASCVAGGPPLPALKPQSKCDGNGTCVTPANVNCAPGRCDATALMCINSCTTSADCTAPNTCVNGSCGLIAKGGTCATTTQCVAGLTCNHDKVCCNATCDGVCETCKPPTGPAGTCTAVAAGQLDPSMMCAVTTSTTCGTNGKCTGNNTPTGTARCQDYDATTTCGLQSCTDSATAGVASVLKSPSTCSGTGTCTPNMTDCGAFKCLNATQCRTSCTVDTDCVGVPCNTFTHMCGNKQAPGASCLMASDCGATAPNCVDGVCCQTACAGACQACAAGTGICGPVPVNTPDAMCPAAAPNTCGNTGNCAAGGACAKHGAETTCRAASCSLDTLSSVAATKCNGTDTCPAAAAPVLCGAPTCTMLTPTSYSQMTAATCSGAGLCAGGVTASCGTFTCNATNTACLTMCATDAQCANGLGCNTSTGQCTGWVNGHPCPNSTGSCGSGFCVDGVCCNAACNGTCRACNLPGTVGMCSNVTSGADVGCPAAGPGNVCGNTGQCGMGGVCAQALPTTMCGTQTCTGDSTLTPVGNCNGAGSCTQTPGTCPNNLKCADGTNCVADCMGDPSQCAAAFTTCNMDGSCSP